MTVIGSLTSSLIGNLTASLAGVATPIIPPDEIANLALWYEIATTNVIKDGSGNISQITDLSGNARHATQGSIGNTYLFVDSVINGKPVARSNGASNNYVVNGTFLQNTDVTIMSVQKRTASGQNIIFANNNRDNIVRWEYANDSFIRFTTRSGSGPTGASTATVPVPYAGGSEPFYIMAVTFSNANGAKYYENGVLIGSSPTHTVRNASNPAARLGKYAGNQNRWFTGDLFGKVMYDREVSNNDLNNLFNYFSNLTGIPVSQL